MTQDDATPRHHCREKATPEHLSRFIQLERSQVSANGSEERVVGIALNVFAKVQVDGVELASRGVGFGFSVHQHHHSGRVDPPKAHTRVHDTDPGSYLAHNLHLFGFRYS